MKVSDLDSKEELYFYWWLLELEEYGFISDIKRADSYDLFDKVESCGHTILEKHSYTPDFKFKVLRQDYFFQQLSSMVVSPKARKEQRLITHNTPLESLECIVETKGSFDNQNMTRLFRINQKWVWKAYNSYVNLVKVPDLFKKTFLPKRYLLTDKTEKARKINFKYKLLKDIINEG